MLMERRVRWKPHARCGAGEKAEGSSKPYLSLLTMGVFQKIKDYLQRNNMTQKQFVIGLIENEIERDLTQRAVMNEVSIDSEKVAEEYTEQNETAAVSDCEAIPDKDEEVAEEQESTDFSDDFDDENEESENPDEDEELDESEEQDEGMAMGMWQGIVIMQRNAMKAFWLSFCLLPHIILGKEA